jgi:hypothetical protein
MLGIPSGLLNDPNAPGGDSPEQENMRLLQHGVAPWMTRLEQRWRPTRTCSRSLTGRSRWTTRGSSGRIFRRGGTRIGWAGRAVGSRRTRSGRVRACRAWMAAIRSRRRRLVALRTVLRPATATREARAMPTPNDEGRASSASRCRSHRSSSTRPVTRKRAEAGRCAATPPCSTASRTTWAASGSRSPRVLHERARQQPGRASAVSTTCGMSSRDPKNNSLELREDPMGLHVWARFAKTPPPTRLATLMDGGYIDQMSFACDVGASEWTEDRTGTSRGICSSAEAALTTSRCALRARSRRPTLSLVASLNDAGALLASAIEAGHVIRRDIPDLVAAHGPGGEGHGIAQPGAEGAADVADSDETRVNELQDWAKARYLQARAAR